MIDRSDSTGRWTIMFHQCGAEVNHWLIVRVSWQSMKPPMCHAFGPGGLDNRLAPVQWMQSSRPARHVQEPGGLVCSPVTPCADRVRVFVRVRRVARGVVALHD